ncbi:MAG: nucleotidyltransferase [Magnetococcales bacterium]|nr:nucleotidyltransferase substrate binding protein [Magnetococcales bacterium]NGZ28149.1 nucleotidyltransferase [Magnetococcales bacterium]
MNVNKPDTTPVWVEPDDDLTPLARAVERLDEGLSRYQQDVADLQIRDGLIKRFEFTYEITHKMLKRFLKRASPSADIFDQMPFSDLIRTGNAYGLLLGNWESWKKYREQSGKTKYSYDEQTAVGVVQFIPAFLKEAQFLLEQLQKRIDKI